MHDSKLTTGENLNRAELVVLGTIKMPEIRDITDAQIQEVLDISLLLRQEVSYDNPEMLTDDQRRAFSLRTVLDIGIGRECLLTAHQSEPMMAEAAAQVLTKLWKTKIGHGSGGDRVRKILHTFLSHDLLSKGEAGEVMARFLCMEAYLRAMQTSWDRDGCEGPLIYSAGCKLKDFFNHLFTREAVEIVFKTTPQNVPGNTTLETIFSTSVVRFCQTIRLGDDALNPLVLLAAFLRGEMLATYHNHRLIDLVIPVLLDSTQPLDVDNITAILVSVKQRDKKLSGKDIYDADDLLFGPDQLRPYIMVIMELGLPLEERKQASQVVIRSRNIHGNVRGPQPVNEYYGAYQGVRVTPHLISEPKIQPNPEDTQASLPPRYGIRALGCSSLVFAGIDPGDDGFYQDLLGEPHHYITQPVEQDDPKARATQQYNHLNKSWLTNKLLQEEFDRGQGRIREKDAK